MHMVADYHVCLYVSQVSSRTHHVESQNKQINIFRSSNLATNVKGGVYMGNLVPE